MQTPVKTLLYASDLSEGSAYALNYAVKLAGMLDARVHILHALEPISEEARMTMRMFLSSKEAQRKAIKARKQTALEMLHERQREFWNDASPEVAALRDRVAGVEVIEGFSAEVILERAKTLPADMILMGSHEHGFNHTFLGQTAKRVLRRSRTPTLIIPYPTKGKK